MAEKPVLVVRIGNVNVEAAPGQAGGAILKDNFVKAIQSNFTVSVG